MVINLQDMRKAFPRDLMELVAATTMIFIFGVWEHLPVIVPNHYTDISSVFWREGVGNGLHLIPYFQFMFEYPVIVGVLVYLSSAVRLIVPDFSIAINYYTLIMDLILYPFVVGTVIVLYRIVEIVKGQKSRIWKAFIIMPSFLMFTVYNWDIIAVFFAVLSLFYYLKQEKMKSALSLGLGISTKLFPCMLLPVYLLEERNWSSRLKILFLSLGTFLALNLPFIIANFDGWFETIKYHATWGIEDSWLIFFFNQMDQNAHYAGLAVILYLVYKGLSGTHNKQYTNFHTRVIERSFLMNVAWLFGNYVVTPQMALMLLPFFVLIPTISLPVIYVAEIMNALIIVLWFTPQFNLGNPLVASSPVQWFAAGRQFIWIGLFIQILYPNQTQKLFEKLTKRLGEPS